MCQIIAFNNMRSSSGISSILSAMIQNLEFFFGRFLHGVDNRDKFCKLLQYIAKICNWRAAAFLENHRRLATLRGTNTLTTVNNGNAMLDNRFLVIAQQVGKMESPISAGRKVLRLGQFLNFYYDLFKRIIAWHRHRIQHKCAAAATTTTATPCENERKQNHDLNDHSNNNSKMISSSAPNNNKNNNEKKTTIEDRIVDVVTQLRLFVLSTFYLYDNLTFVARAGLIPEKSKEEQQKKYDRMPIARYYSHMSVRYSMFSVICTIILDAISFLRVLRKEQQLNHELAELAQSAPMITSSTTTTTTYPHEAQQQESNNINNIDDDDDDHNNSQQRRRRQIKISESLDDLWKEKLAFCLTFVKDFSDLGVAVGYYQKSDAAMALLGFLSSAISIYTSASKMKS